MSNIHRETYAGCVACAERLSHVARNDVGPIPACNTTSGVLSRVFVDEASSQLSSCRRRWLERLERGLEHLPLRSRLRVSHRKQFPSATPSIVLSAVQCQLSSLV